MDNLFSLDTRNEYVLFFNSFKNSKTDFSWIEKYPNVFLKRSSFPNKLLNFSLWYLNWPKLDQLVGGTDIFFMPNIGFGSVSKKSRLIVTMHDLSFERYPETFSWKRRLWHMFINPKKICWRADKIIAVSESTRNDIIKIYGIDEKKINVVYSGIAEKFCVLDRNDEGLIKVKEKYGLPYKFILYLGTIEPRKNIVGIVRAYNDLQEWAKKNKSEEFFKYKLIIAGSRGWLSEKIFREISKSEHKEDIGVLNFIQEKDKEFILNLSSLFVYPSLFEGFGFPPLEAMACGVPVIASNNSSLPEVVGNGGALIDPDKPDEIFHAMKEILSGSDLRGNIVAKGLAQAGKFSWEKAAEDFLKMINRM